MAEIITKDSEEFKELTGWMKKDRKIGGGGDGKDTSPPSRTNITCRGKTCAKCCTSQKGPADAA